MMPTTITDITADTKASEEKLDRETAEKSTKDWERWLDLTEKRFLVIYSSPFFQKEEPQITITIRNSGEIVLDNVNGWDYDFEFYMLQNPAATNWLDPLTIHSNLMTRIGLKKQRIQNALIKIGLYLKVGDGDKGHYKLWRNVHRNIPANPPTVKLVRTLANFLGSRFALQEKLGEVK